MSRAEEKPIVDGEVTVGEHEISSLQNKVKMLF